jgi:dephospho-CoA kinase
MAELGAAVLSADDVAREVVAPGSPMLPHLVAAFGPGILSADGTLNRELLAQIVFRSPEERAKLNALMHPAIAARAEKRLQELSRLGSDLVVYEAPLLFEAGGDARVDEVLVVFVEPAVQIARLCVREGIDREAAKARVAAHWPQHAKLARADYVIDNSRSVEETRRQVKALFIYLTRDCEVR